MDTSLTPQQLSAVESPTDSHVRVVACPGSGKSRCLVARVQVLLGRGVQSSRIRVTTFSRQAARDISARLPPDVEVQTIHAMARRYDLFGPLSKEDNCMISDDPVVKTIEEVDADTAAGPFYSVDEHVYRMKRSLEKEGDSHVPDVDHMLVDEFQDLDPEQFCILSLMAERWGTRMFAAGDPNQSIYGFRRGSSSFLTRGMETLKGHPVLTFNLDTNFRSLPPIVALSNAIRPDSGTPPSDSHRGQGHRGVASFPRLACFFSKAKELEWVLQELLALVSSGESPGDIAVVSRTQKDCYAICHKATERGIVSRVVTGDSDANVSRHAITICTMHGSKGLEWKHVILTGCSDFYNRHLLTADDAVQEANLFYVAVTRAKDTLTFTSPSRMLTRLLFRAGHLLETVAPNADVGIVQPVRKSDSSGSFVRPARSVTHFVSHASGEVYARLKEAGIIPETYPGATLVRHHSMHSPPAGNVEPICYATFVERVIYRQIDARCRAALIDLGCDPSAVASMKSVDNHASACFLFVEDRCDGESLGEETLFRHTDDKAREFGLPRECVRVICEEGLLPAYTKARDVLYTGNSPYKTFFDSHVKQLKDSYRRYINGNVGWKTDDDISVLSDVALCAHLVHAPAKTHLLFNRASPGHNRGLFEQTSRVVESLPFVPAKIDALPKVATSEFYLAALGVAFDVDLSTPSIYGFADIVVGSTMLEIKCSLERSAGAVQMPWVLQLLVYTALARSKGFMIDKIAVYNPLRGTVWSAPIDGWDRHAELLDFVNSYLSGEGGLVPVIS